MLKSFFTNLSRYRFLLEQLILRDFKVKYKRSVLGVFWSLLNPLLTMTVMYMVFSNFFKFSIDNVNYMVYLLTGLTFFNYFSEASNLAMGSVVANFPLINKTYIPKYIFPLSKCLFVGINFVMTLIPLYLFIFFTGEGITKCVVGPLHLLLPYSYICLFFFTLGIGFITSTVSVFFRDMFYIYNIIITLWMYLTPVMYDLSMINPTLQFIFKLNPLYQIINFARTIILYNKLPTLWAFLACALYAGGAFALGAFVFKKNQDKFIYYI